jgi:hypothetical protein
MQTIQTGLLINASPESVRKALVEIPFYPMKIRKAIRNRKIGQNLSVPMISGGWSVTLIVKVPAVDPPRHIRWKGYLWIPGLSDGEHSFEIREDKRVTKRVERETFSSLLLPFPARRVRDTKQESERVNASIRDAAEPGGSETIT